MRDLWFLLGGALIGGLIFCAVGALLRRFLDLD